MAQMDPAPLCNVQARLAALLSNLQQPDVNPFAYGGLALQFVTAQEERAAQAVLRGLPPVVQNCIRMESGTGFARLMAAAFRCGADLKAAVELLLRQRAPGGLGWDRLLAIERQCNLWTRDAFYVMTGVRLLDDSRLLQTDVVTKTLEHWRSRAAAAAAARGRGLQPPAPARAPRGWGPGLSAPAPSPAPTPAPAAEQIGWCRHPSAPAPMAWQPPHSALALRGFGGPPSAPAQGCPPAPMGAHCTGCCDSCVPRTLNM